VTAILRCATCGAEVDAAAVWTFRCPADRGDRHHVLHRIPQVRPFRPLNDPNPFVRSAPYSLWWDTAAALGMSEDDRLALVRELDTAIEAVDGRGFRVTPFDRSDALSDALGFSGTGGVCIKDETGNVSGSHKARHLMSTMLHLLVAERCGVAPAAHRPRLAIASCGNAALGAATIARAADWPIDVFVPTTANPTVVDGLRALGAEVVFCPRRPDDPPGDPCVHRFREAVAIPPGSRVPASLPFSVQGPENAYALDGGRTLGHELYEVGGAMVDRVFVQVGGGALATGVAQGLADGGVRWRMHAVQTARCAPLDRAWRRMQERHLDARHAPQRWQELMWPWEEEPHSVATGILDDETYDWVGIVQALEGGGSSVVVTESQLEEANRLVRHVAGIDADHTGSAALAGLLAIRSEIADDEVVAVLVTGVRRS
jgi:threonine synthase